MHRQAAAERRSVAAEKAPDSWVGERVGVLVGARAELFNGPLLEVSDRGVVISYLHNLEEVKSAENVEPLFLPFFFPWHSVVGIHRMPEQDE